MENNLIKIVKILVRNPIFLENVLQFAIHLGALQQKLVILTREVRNSTVDYHNSVKMLFEDWISREGRKTLGDIVQVLKGMDCVDLAEILAEKYKASESLTGIAKTGLPKVWNAIDPVPTFVGRNQELKKLDESEKRLLVVSGTGGQGKTQLCRKWTQNLKNIEDCPIIIWLSGESNQALTSTIVNYVNTFFGELDKSKAKSLEEIMTQLSTLIDRDDKMLWIIDSVDNNEIENFPVSLLVNVGISKLLFTTRLPILQFEGAEYLSLETLSPDEACQLVRENVKRDLDENDVKALCQIMQNHALSLQLSLGFIRTKAETVQGFGIQDFLKGWTLSGQEDIKAGPSDYDDTVLRLVKPSLEYLQEKSLGLAQQIMGVLSFFNADGIEVGFLLEMMHVSVSGSAGVTAGEVRNALGVLQSLSLANSNSEQKLATVHPLVQEMTRLLLKNRILVADSILRNIEITNLSKKNLQHFLPLWEVICKEDSLFRSHVERADEIFSGLLRYSEIHSLLPFTESLMENVKRVWGNSKFPKGDFMHGHAQVRAGKYKEGLSNLQLAHKEAIELYGEYEPLTLAVEEGVGNALENLGKSEEAVELYQKLLPRFISVHGENGSRTMKLKNNLALALSKCNRFADALNIYLKIVEWERMEYTPLHPDIIATRQNIASCYFKMGDFKNAESEYQSI